MMLHQCSTFILTATSAVVRREFLDLPSSQIHCTNIRGSPDFRVC